MSIDLVGNFIATRNGYGRLRGTTPARGGNGLSAGKGVPKTTWADVVVASQHFRKYAAPTLSQCESLVMQHRGVGEIEAGAICRFGDRNSSPRNFVKTPGYDIALARFDAVSPVQAFGLFTVARKGASGEVYPKNEEFWGAAQSLALERTAAGEVPFWSDIAVASVREAVSELPENVGKALSVIDPRKLIPSGPPIMKIVKWGSVGVGIFMISWLAIKLNDRRKA